MEPKVIFAELKLKEAFDELSNKDPRLYKEIEKSFEEMKQNMYCGRNVKKNLIPRNLIEKFGINNLWIYNLRKDWRLLYSLAHDEIEILALILDWMNHKDYERLFKF
jgi:hypothetical protein